MVSRRDQSLMRHCNLTIDAMCPPNTSVQAIFFFGTQFIRYPPQKKSPVRPLVHPTGGGVVQWLVPSQKIC